VAASDGDEGGVSVVLTPRDADALAERLLGDLRTRLGGLHIAHARRMAAALGDEVDDTTYAAALLHDVIEKTDVTADVLLDLTGDAAVVHLVEVLTQNDDEPDELYLARCAAEPAALLLKRLDLTDKFVAEVDVPEETAAAIRRQALSRLAMLDRIAREGAANQPEAAVHGLRPVPGGLDGSAARHRRSAATPSLSTRSGACRGG
jgi:hypothetical protein